MLQDHLGVSARGACRYVGQPRSTQCHRPPAVAQDDAALRANCVVFAPAAAVGISPSASASARARAGRSTGSDPAVVARGGPAGPGEASQASAARGIHAARCSSRAERPYHVWAFDFQFDVTDYGRAVKLLYIVDEFTREALAMEAERRIDADRVVEALDRIVSDQGRRRVRACDNGTEMTSAALRTGIASEPDRRRVHRNRQPGEPLCGVVQQPRPDELLRRGSVPAGPRSR